MKIVITSQSDLKVAAVQAAFAAVTDAQFVRVKAPSGVNEQPEGKHETLKGAFNRIGHAKVIVPDADYYISIESGLFDFDPQTDIYLDADTRYVDKAAVVILSGERETPSITFSEAVAFPAEAVEKARARGFEKVTVGQVLEEMNMVTQHNDPHLSLTGRSRVDYMTEATKRAIMFDQQIVQAAQRSTLA